jgi:hypothetical protein
MKQGPAYIDVRVPVRGVRSRGAQCAYAPPVSKQVGHMPP